MNKNRLVTLGIVGAIAIVAVLGWFVGVSPILDQTSATSQQVSSVAGINDINQTKLITLKKQYENISAVQSKLDAVRGSLPETADYPTFLREINATAAEHHVTLKDASWDDSVAYKAPTAAAPTPAAGDATATPSPSPSPSVAPAGGAPVAEAPTVGDGLVVIPVKITVTGSYDDVLAFEGDLESGARLLLVDSFAVTNTDGNFSGAISGKIYALPTTAPAAAGAAASTTP